MPANRESAAYVHRELDKIVDMIAAIGIKLSFLITLIDAENEELSRPVPRPRSRSGERARRRVSRSGKVPAVL
ncbi:MAG: hypothetical protein JXD23_00690 [Spirochaetales bacterium]|nr:hypothetical protein [Spirochaetales bacterium]